MEKIIPIITLKNIISKKKIKVENTKLTIYNYLFSHLKGEYYIPIYTFLGNTSHSITDEIIIKIKKLYQQYTEKEAYKSIKSIEFINQTSENKVDILLNKLILGTITRREYNTLEQMELLPDKLTITELQNILEYIMKSYYSTEYKILQPENHYKLDNKTTPKIPLTLHNWDIITSLSNYISLIKFNQFPSKYYASAHPDGVEIFNKKFGWILPPLNNLPPNAQVINYDENTFLKLFKKYEDNIFYYAYLEEYTSNKAFIPITAIAISPYYKNIYYQLPVLAHRHSIEMDEELVNLNTSNLYQYMHKIFIIRTPLKETIKYNITQKEATLTPKSLMKKGIFFILNHSDTTLLKQLNLL